MGDLTPEQLLGIKPTVEPLELEGHGKVYLRGLTARERDDYEQAQIELGPDGRMRAKMRQRNPRASLVVKCLVDGQTGERLFKDNEVEKLGEMDGRVIDTLWAQARKLSGMRDEEQVQEAAESFDTAQDEGNSSE